MIPLAAISGYLTANKWLLYGALLVGAYGAGFFQGQKSEIRKQVSAGIDEVRKERRIASTSIKEAAKNAEALAEEKMRNEDLLKRLEEASQPSVCTPSDDQLRILNEIAAASGKGR